jgi:hypothetical protein
MWALDTFGPKDQGWAPYVWAVLATGWIVTLITRPFLARHLAVWKRRTPVAPFIVFIVSGAICAAVFIATGEPPPQQTAKNDQPLEPPPVERSPAPIIPKDDDRASAVEEPKEKQPKEPSKKQDSSISVETHGPDSPAVVTTGSNSPVTINPRANPNAPVVTYDFNGTRRISSPSGSEATAGEEFDAFQGMAVAEKNREWKALLAMADVWMKKTPDWITPSLFAGVAEAQLGNRERAIKLFKDVDRRAAGNPDWSAADLNLRALGAKSEEDTKAPINKPNLPKQRKPTIQQSSAGPNSPNIVTTGPNSPVTINPAIREPEFRIEPRFENRMVGAEYHTEFLFVVDTQVAIPSLVFEVHAPTIISLEASSPTAPMTGHSGVREKEGFAFTTLLNASGTYYVTVVTRGVERLGIKYGY